jgi:hypothetical protein
MDDTGPLMGALNARAQLLQKREQQVFRQRAMSNPQRAPADLIGHGAHKGVPPVPPLPEQYRHKPWNKI